MSNTVKEPKSIRDKDHSVSSFDSISSNLSSGVNSEAKPIAPNSLKF